MKNLGFEKFDELPCQYFPEDYFPWFDMQFNSLDSVILINVLILDSEVTMVSMYEVNSIKVVVI